MTYRIAFTGQKGSGKDTCCNITLTTIPEAEVLSFAGKLKSMCAATFNIAWGALLDSKEDEIAFSTKDSLLKRMILDMQVISGVSVDITPEDVLSLLQKNGVECFSVMGGYVLFGKPRTVLQVVGTDIGRQMFKDDLWINHLISNLPEKTDILINDCRFDNEYEALKKEGFTVVCVHRPSLTNIDEHVSEQGCRYDHLLVNDGTLSDLAVELHKILFSL